MSATIIHFQLSLIGKYFSCYKLIAVAFVIAMLFDNATTPAPFLPHKLHTAAATPIVVDNSTMLLKKKG